MKRVTGSVSSPGQHSVRELLTRVVRVFTGEPVAESPEIRWAEMKPVDFEGEDTSLSQDHLALMR